MAERDSAAKRRRDRRLRMHWRHEQLTLRMALAAALHHSRDVGPVTYNALRSQKTAKAWEEEENEMYFATGQMTPPPRAAAAEYYPLTPGAEAGGVLAAGGRPSPLVEVRPQDRVLRRTVEQNVDAVTFPTLDVPMPQRVDQPLALLLSVHFLIPRRLLTCPRSRCQPAPHADSRGCCRRRSSWLKCHWMVRVCSFAKQCCATPIGKRPCISPLICTRCLVSESIGNDIGR